MKIKLCWNFFNASVAIMLVKFDNKSEGVCKKLQGTFVNMSMFNTCYILKIIRVVTLILM